MPITYRFEEITVTRFYPENDPIWQLPTLKQQRKMIADVQREITVEADFLANIPYETEANGPSSVLD